MLPFRALPLLLPAMLILTGASLPEDGPVPGQKPAEAAAPIDNTAAQDTPVPQPKPAEPDGDAAAPAEKVPAPKPDAASSAPQEPGKKEAEPAATDSKPEETAAQPVAAEDPKAYATCLSELKAMGASFEELPRIDEGKGCGIDKPLSVSALLPGVTLAPKATLRCEAALELARWTKEAVLPAASAAMADEGAMTTVNQASGYVCRLRNNAATGKISEHARGNAIDIASFTFKSGKTVAIQPRDEDGTMPGAFQRAVTATGCLYFETVLDPGSDEAHENHLHFDVLQRRGGYRYCR